MFIIFKSVGPMTRTVVSCLGYNVRRISNNKICDSVPFCTCINGSLSRQSENVCAELLLKYVNDHTDTTCRDSLLNKSGSSARDYKIVFAPQHDEQLYSHNHVEAASQPRRSRRTVLVFGFTTYVQKQSPITTIVSAN